MSFYFYSPIISPSCSPQHFPFRVFQLFELLTFFILFNLTLFSITVFFCLVTFLIISQLSRDVLFRPFLCLSLSFSLFESSSHNLVLFQECFSFSQDGFLTPSNASSLSFFLIISQSTLLIFASYLSSFLSLSYSLSRFFHLELNFLSAINFIISFSLSLNF